MIRNPEHNKAAARGLRCAPPVRPHAVGEGRGGPMASLIGEILGAFVLVFLIAKLFPKIF